MTLRSDRYVNSPHQTGIENEEYYQLKRCDLDITPNSYDYPTKKSMVLVRRMKIVRDRAKVLSGGGGGGGGGVGAKEKRVDEICGRGTLGNFYLISLK